MPKNGWQPWRDYHEDLSLPRLIQLGNLLRSVWQRVSELHEPDEGDGAWSMSCRAFQRCGYQLSQKQQDWPWLSIVEQKTMQWVVCVGVIPVRFYHGDAQEVPQRYSAPPDTEEMMRQVLLNLDDRIRAGVLLRLVTETDKAGVPLNVKLIEYEEASQDVINTFILPETVEGTRVEVFPKPQQKPGVIQPKPVARPLFGRAKGQSDDANPSKK